MPLPTSTRVAAALSRFNSAPSEAATALLLRCCGSTSWAARIAAFRPYPDADSLLAAMDEASYDMTPEDVTEALASETPQLPTPRGGDGEHAHARGAERTREQDLGRPREEDRGRGVPDRRGLVAAHTALRAAHAAYEQRFGHAFLLCLDEWAEGERLGQALAHVRARLGNDPEEERPIVAEELRRLARGRLLRSLR